MHSIAGRRIAGNGVAHPLGAVPAGRVEPDLPVQVTVVLRPQNARAHVRPSPAHPARHVVHSTEELAVRYDPGRDRVDAARQFARSRGLAVVEVSRARHDVVLAGTVEQCSRALGVTLQYFDYALGRYRAHDERPRLPAELRGVVESVLGLDDVPAQRPSVAAAPRASFVDVATLERQYAFPAVDASAQRIALLECGGGFGHDDIAAYAQRLGLRHPPRITTVPVQGATGPAATNAPLDRARAAAIARDWKASASMAALLAAHGRADVGAFMDSMEVTMDLELALALGGGAAVDVYFAPGGVDGWRRALYAVIGLPVGGADAAHPPVPTVLSASWGDSEAVFGPAQLRVIDRALVAVQRAGVAVCCSSGDWGSVNAAPRPGGPAAHPNVNFPASSPSVLACGGTRLLPADAEVGDAAVRPEVAWTEHVLQVSMATGGGMSGYFARPLHQRELTARPARGTWRAPGREDAVGRWLPDVAANAAWSSGPAITFAGEQLVGFGTSAATPICAALLARVSAVVGHRVAGLAGWLYSPAGRACCRPVTEGDNDVTQGAVPFYHAGPGWNACTGLGALQGTQLAAALTATAGRGRTARDRTSSVWR